MSATRYERLNSSKIDATNYINDEEIDLDGEHRLKTCKTNLNGNNSNSTSTTSTTTVQGSEFMQMAIGTLIIILLYLSLSICLTFYQGALIKVIIKVIAMNCIIKLYFFQSLKFPFTIVIYHLIVKLIMSSCVRSMYKCRVGKSRVQLDWRTSLRKMAPTGIASGIDIGFSNWGFELVQISLYTITKSTTIIFILFFAILLGLEKRVCATSFMYIIYYTQNLLLVSKNK